MTAALHEAAAEFARAHALLNNGAGAAAAAAATAADGSEAGQDVRVVLGQAIRKLKQHWKLGKRVAGIRQVFPLVCLWFGAAVAGHTLGCYMLINRGRRCR